MWIATLCVRVRAHTCVCVCVKIKGDHRVDAYLVDTSIHVITPLSIIISAKIIID